MICMQFQSTLPMRGVTVSNLDLASTIIISIHTPHAGSDQWEREAWFDTHAISIHTPHAGSDETDHA